MKVDVPLNKKKTKYIIRSGPRDIVSNVLDSNIIESEFKLHLCQYIHFPTHIL